MKLQGKQITLRSPRITDLDALTKHANNRVISKWMGPHFPYPYKRADGRRFLNDTKSKHRKKLAKRFAIYHLEAKELIGMIGLERIDHENKQAEVGYWLAQDYWRQGIMSEALVLLAEFAFKKEKFHRLFARVYGENPGSMKLLEKHGFKKEGVLRDNVYEYKAWHDTHIYGLLESDLKKRR